MMLTNLRRAVARLRGREPDTVDPNPAYQVRLASVVKAAHAWPLDSTGTRHGVLIGARVPLNEAETVKFARWQERFGPKMESTECES